MSTQTEFDAHGHQAGPGKAAAPMVTAAPASAKACLTLHGPGGAVFPIDITYNPQSYPFAITGGTIKGTICDAPNWTLTGGSFGTTLTLNGKHTGSGACASTITVVGNYQSPGCYTGTYGFNGQSNSFQHTSVYCCGACP